VIGIDSNVLIYAHRRDSPFHDHAADALRTIAASPTAWAIPWPCAHEFYSVATNPRVYSPASTPTEALHQLRSWMASPTLRLLAESAGYYETLVSLLAESNLRGPKVHDARIAAICLSHGVTELLTMDRDFSRLPALRTRSLLA
jgi:toxin-antitoxin system PIN domain toxin